VRIRRRDVDPESVFTPRSAEVNEKVYVSRKDVEENFERGLKGNMHLILTGESGSGKSWMSKRLIRKIGCSYTILNCAKVAMDDSFEPALKFLTSQKQPFTNTKYSETKSAEANVAVAKGSLEIEREYEKSGEDTYYQFLRSRHTGKKSHYVLTDNFERIFGKKKLVDDLASMITMLDDDDYSKFNVKFLIIGTSKQIQQYFQSVPELEPVVNRTRELKKLRLMNKQETLELIEKGFSLLGMEYSDTKELKEFSDYVYDITLGVPQKVHEYCLVFCEEILTKPFTDARLKASFRWVETHLDAVLSIIRPVVKRKKAGNKTLMVMYIFSRHGNGGLTITQIENYIRSEYKDLPRYLNLHKIVKHLIDKGIITSRLGDGEYELRDSNFVTVLRVMLHSDRSVGPYCIYI